jgi:hypothetical protein
VYDQPSHFHPGFAEPSALKGIGGEPHPRSAGSEYFDTTHVVTSPVAIWASVQRAGIDGVTHAVESEESMAATRGPVGAAAALAEAGAVSMANIITA